MTELNMKLRADIRKDV